MPAKYTQSDQLQMVAEFLDDDTVPIEDYELWQLSAMVELYPVVCQAVRSRLRLRGIDEARRCSGRHTSLLRFMAARTLSMDAEKIRIGDTVTIVVPLFTGEDWRWHGWHETGVWKVVNMIDAGPPRECNVGQHANALKLRSIVGAAGEQVASSVYTRKRSLYAAGGVVDGGSAAR